MHSRPTRLSIIVPVLNEADTLPDLIRHLQPLASDGVECILVDGGSEDDSSQHFADWPGTVCESPRGRGRQLRAGADVAHGEVLLFLHADTRLPEGGCQSLLDVMGKQPHGWGRFDVAIEGRAQMLKIIATMMNLRSRLTGIATGDQAIFVSRSLYREIGGVPDQALMEDIELSRRLCERMRPYCLRTRVTTSGRRWESRGIWKTILLMWRLRWAYWRGADPSDLVRIYR